MQTQAELKLTLKGKKQTKSKHICKNLNNYITEFLRLRLSISKIFFFFSLALSSPLATPSTSSSPAYSPPVPAGGPSLPPPMMTSASLPVVPSATVSTIAPPLTPAPPHVAPLSFSTSVSQFSTPPPLSSTTGSSLPAPPTGPPISGFSISSTYDITRGHAGRAPQSPLMPSFSAPPVTGNFLYICFHVCETG